MDVEESTEKKKRTRRNIIRYAKELRFGKINLNKYFLIEEKDEKIKESTDFPTYTNIVIKTRRMKPVVRICNVCFLLGNYTCPRCSDRYCSKDCFKTHKEIKCVKYIDL
jgi:zinc finger HIT domain-containing protein 1